ncbi:MAG: chromosome segregation protein SMC [Nanoarchaeota archaeon]
MTYIEKTYIRGFKSFANPLELEFGRGFNCFIGANGSGKTNLHDGLTFVLGKRSSKQMRAENVASLIFNGGKKGSPMREAEVSIFFSNREKEFPLATQTVKISRIVRQSGTSIFKINDEKRTRQQVVDLLSKARINPDGFNIVLQGDITLFAEMKPEDRRVLIEDISGISVYEDKKHKALLELEKVDQKLNDANIILKEREVHLRELKKERDQAMKFKELESKIKESKATYLHLQVKDKEFKKDEIESRIKKQEATIEQITNRINETKERIGLKKKELEEINKEIETKGEIEQITLQKNIESLREAIIKESIRLETVTNEISHVNKRIADLHANEKEISDKIKELESELQKLSKESKMLIEGEKKIISEINSAKEKHDVSNIERMESELETLQSRLFRIKYELSNEHLQKNKLSQELEAINSNIDRVSSPELKKKIGDFNRLDEELSKTVDKWNVTSSLIDNNKNRLAALKEELSNLEGTKIRLAQSMMGNQAVSLVLDSNIKGVFGTIASLGSVEPKYSVALEVAASGRINSIITDTDATAANCIRLLKEKKIGVAMFLPLNKIQERVNIKELEQLKNFSGVIDVAKNLIKYDKKFEKVFSYVFGSTLVVNDLNTARKVGVGRTRMVTLDGDLAEQSGAMIGGFRKKTLGVFEQKDINSEISKKELEIDNLKKEIDKLTKQYQNEQEEIRKMTREKAMLEAEITKLQYVSSITDMGELRSKKNELTSLIKNLEKKIKSLESEENKIKDQIEKLREKRKLLGKESNIESLHEKHKQLREAISQNNAQIKNIQNQISSIYKPEIEKIEEIIAQHKKELEEFSKEERSLKWSLSISKQKFMDAEASERKFRENYKSLFDNRHKKSDETRKLEGQIEQDYFRQREIEKKINEISLERAKTVAELEALQQEFEPYIGVKLRRNISSDDLKKEINEFEKLLSNIGSVNLRALDVYETILKEFEELTNKKESLQKEKDAVLALMAEIEGKKKRVFLKTYKQIADNFQRIFSTLSTKGDAYLELEDKENPLNGGINIRVKLAGTKFLDLHSLSGGEKTLTALAMIFAIQEYEPAPFYLFDEIDATLDKINSQLLSRLIAQYAKVSQIIMISHNDNIITDADYIYGVSMQQNGISKVTSLRL